MTTINIRIDETTKKTSQKVFKEMGMDLTTGIKIFLNTVNREKKIPFEIKTENGFTPEYEQEILKELTEIEEELKTGKRKGYNSFSEILAEIDEEIKAEKENV